MRWYNKPYEKEYETGGTIGGGPDPMWGKTYTTTWLREATVGIGPVVVLCILIGIPLLIMKCGGG